MTLLHLKPVSSYFFSFSFYATYQQGAAEGAGLGNAFLSHIRAVDAIFMMLRAFENADITHVEGDVNPVRDIEIINEELLLKVPFIVYAGSVAVTYRRFV